MNIQKIREDFPILQKQRKWSREKIQTEFYSFRNFLGKTPKEKDFKKHKKYGLYKALIRNFGSYTKSLHHFKMEPNLKSWNRSNIIREFKKVARELGHVPTYRELVKLKRLDLISAIERHYGYKYNIVVKKSGFKPNNIRWDKTRIKLELTKLSKRIGRTPTERDLKRNKCDLLGAATRHFGSLNDAVKHCKLKTNKSFVEDDLWKYWERFVLKTAKLIHPGVVYHPRLPNKSIPDAMIEPNRTIIEAKLNISGDFILQDIEDYRPFADKIEFWYLYGKPTVKNKMVKFVSPEQIEEMLRANGNEELLEDLDLLKRGIKC